MLKFLAVACLILWAVAVIGLLPSLVRSFKNDSHVSDEWQATTFFGGLVLIGFIVRRLVYSGGSEGLVMLYVVSATLAAYVLILLWQGRNG